MTIRGVGKKILAFGRQCRLEIFPARLSNRSGNYENCQAFSSFAPTLISLSYAKAVECESEKSFAIGIMGCGKSKKATGDRRNTDAESNVEANSPNIAVDSAEVNVNQGEDIWDQEDWAAFRWVYQLCFQ